MAKKEVSVPQFDLKLLIIPIVSSIIGMIYIGYGKKKNLYFAFTGIALIVMPYFAKGMTAKLVALAALVFLPFILSLLL